jgi:hypothetical protein
VHIWQVNDAIDAPAIAQHEGHTGPVHAVGWNPRLAMMASCSHETVSTQHHHHHPYPTTVPHPAKAIAVVRVNKCLFGAGSSMALYGWTSIDGFLVCRIVTSTFSTQSGVRTLPL